MKLAFFIGDAYVFGVAILTFLSLSRWLFDKPLKEHNGEAGRFLFLKRLGIVIVWPLALASGGGRRVISYLMKGE